MTSEKHFIVLDIKYKIASAEIILKCHLQLVKYVELTYRNIICAIKYYIVENKT